MEVFSVGTKVVLQDLPPSARDHEGAHGIIQEYLPAQARYSIRLLNNGQLVAVQEKHLQLTNSPPGIPNPRSRNRVSSTSASRARSVPYRGRSRARAATDVEERGVPGTISRLMTLEFEPGRTVGATEQDGVILRVAPNSQAYRMGVKVGWQITHVNGFEVGVETAPDLIRKMQTQGQTYTITFRRPAKTAAKEGSNRPPRPLRPRSASPVSPAQRTEYTWTTQDRIKVIEEFRLSGRKPGKLGTILTVLPDGKIRIRWDSGKIQALGPPSFAKIAKAPNAAPAPLVNQSRRGRRAVSPQLRSTDPRRAMGLPPRQSSRDRGRSYSPKRNIGIERKAGPRDIGRNDHIELASERAGIRPMKYSEQTWDPNLFKRKITQSSLKGFSSMANEDVAGPGEMGRNRSGRKMGPRECRLDGATTQLASERAGIQPMVYSEINHDADFTKAKITNASLKGFSVTKTEEPKYRRFLDGQTNDEGRKMGPREMGISATLASERAGIKPMKYSEMIHDADFTKQKITRASLKGFSTTSVNEQPGNLSIGAYGTDGRKLGPIELRLTGNQGKLASERHGIKPMRYSEMVHSDFTKAKITRSALQGFSTTTQRLNDDNGFGEPTRKEGPRDIGWQVNKLESERRGIAPAKYSLMTQDLQANQLQNTTSSLKGHSALQKGGTLNINRSYNQAVNRTNAKPE